MAARTASLTHLTRLAHIASAALRRALRLHTESEIKSVYRDIHRAVQGRDPR